MRDLVKQQAANMALCLVFVVCICLPIADLALGLDKSAPLKENRVLATLPDLASPVLAVVQHPGDRAAWTKLRRAIAAFPADFNRFYNDNFGLRRILVRAHSRLMLLGWPAKGDVIVGREGWLFLGEAPTRESYQASVLFSAKELADWKSELERRRDWLAARGSDYLLVIAPEKSTMYPEYMPGAVPRIGHTTRLDQLTAYLAKTSDLKALDLRADLNQARSQYPTYFRTDTHWNDWGAFVAYQAIMKRLSVDHPQLHPVSATDYTFTEQGMAGGDLAGMLGLEDMLNDKAIVAQRIVPTGVQSAETGIAPLANVPIWGSQPEARGVPGLDAPAAIIFRDSFGKALITFLAQDFRRSLYLNRYGLDEEAIVRERPAIVIQEIAERSLQGSIPPYGNGQ